MRKCKARHDSIRCQNLVPDHLPKWVTWCGPDCGHTIYLARKEKTAKACERNKKAVERKQKREFYEANIKTRKAAAVREFNAYIRARDCGLPCISCRKPAGAGRVDAGHYIPAGNNSLLRFDEFNVNSQCHWDCNIQQSGNRIEYRKGLLAKYGPAVVDRLESTSGTIKRTAQDYKAIEVEYREKRLALQQTDRSEAA